MDRKEVVLGMAELLLRQIADDMSLEGARKVPYRSGERSTAERTAAHDCLGSAGAGERDYV